MPTPDPSNVLAGSTLLGTKKFAGLAELHLRGETPLLAADANLDVFASPGYTGHFGLAAVLTDQPRLVLFQPRGLFGPKNPFSLPLAAVTLKSVSVTDRTGGLAVCIDWREAHGRPGQWLLRVGADRADQWANAIVAAVASSARPAAEATVGGDDVSDDERDRFRRLHDIVDALRPLAAPELLGTPFGTDRDLAEANPLVVAKVNSSSELHSFGHLVMMDMLTEVGKADLDPARAADLMGAGSTDAAFANAQELGVAAQAILAEIMSGGSLRDLWERRDDVAIEFMLWHIIARLRLVTAGLLPPLERPEWA
jgi:hypothetical protein